MFLQRSFERRYILEVAARDVNGGDPLGQPLLDILALLTSHPLTLSLSKGPYAEGWFDGPVLSGAEGLTMSGKP